jgi:hypothetical protein
MISASLALSSASRRAMKSSWIFCSSFSADFFSSSEVPSSFLTRSRASVRACRIAMRPSSASLCSTFTSSLRRCSVMDGSGTRMIPPWCAGSSPSSDSRIAFSMTLAIPLSKGVTRRMRGSGAETEATWLSGSIEP